MTPDPWRFLSNLATVLSLGNLLEVYVRKIGVGSTDFSRMIDDSVARNRIWVTASVLAVCGFVVLGYLFYATRDVANDLDTNAVRKRLITFAIGLVQVVVAAVIAILILAFS